jgi:hypothetical protein
MARVVRGALEYDLTSAEVRQIVQVLLRTDRTPEDVIESILRLRPIVVRRHVLIGGIVSPMVQEHLGSLSQRQRDELLTRALARCLPDHTHGSGHLAADRFTLVGDDDFSKAVRSLPGGFEGAINASLEAEAER